MVSEKKICFKVFPILSLWELRFVLKFFPIISLWGLMTPWPIRPPGAWLEGLIHSTLLHTESVSLGPLGFREEDFERFFTKHCYILNILAVGNMMSEKKMF